MTVNEYDSGESATLTGTFTVDGEPADPAAVVCKLRKPDLEQIEVAAAQVSTGVYEAEVELDQHGDWYYRFFGDGLAGPERRMRVHRAHVV